MEAAIQKKLGFESCLLVLRRLRAAGVKLKFVSNTTKESRATLHAKLTDIGFTIRLDEIVTSLTATRSFVEQRGLRPLLMLEPDAMMEFLGMYDEQQSAAEPNSVVIGLAPSKFGYDDMNRAFRLVLDGAHLIALNKGRYYQRPDGLALGPGPFVMALEYATGKTCSVIGKPEPSFFLEATTSIGCRPEDCFMIGDDVLDDVGGATNVGIKGVLVRTGKYRPGDERKLQQPPYMVCESFSHAVDAIISALGAASPGGRLGNQQELVDSTV